MDQATLRSLLEQNARYVQLNTEGIATAESLRPAPGGANTFNWILGHIAFWRNTLLEMAGLDAVWGEDEARHYRGHPEKRQPVKFDSREALEPARLLADLESMQNKLEAWNGERDGRELPAHFLNMLLHEAYHAGQLGLLRRALGKDGVV